MLIYNRIPISNKILAFPFINFNILFTRLIQWLVVKKGAHIP